MTHPTFTPRDFEQICELGIPLDEVERQLSLFRRPPPPVRLIRPAHPGDGIRLLDSQEHEALLRSFDRAVAEGAVTKFVPASGAASRMFKSLAPLTASPPEDPDSGAAQVFEALDQLAFYQELAAAAQRAGFHLEELRSRRDHRTIARLLLDSEGLGYATLPKGLILFHDYPEGARTAFEEQLVEAAACMRGRDGVCRLHFTVSPEHETAFRRLLGQAAPELGDLFGTRFEVGFSHQDHSTDTLAVDLDNLPFRLEDGSLLFRPGGHGALIRNLGALAREGAEMVLVKNIDNVVPQERVGTIVLWKKLLGGTLLKLRQQVFSLLERLEDPRSASDTPLLDEASELLAGTLGRALPAAFTTAEPESRRRALIDHLDRPLRVCGMVAHEGEPGGGPFWVGSGGELSLQIVEGSQIDLEDPEQREILAASSHFNPVDLACSLRDRLGRPYELGRFVDPATVFISAKTYHGRSLKALELPGLWNGAMALWNTVFVEVPLATFAPVKTVADLLRPEHQGPARASDRGGKKR